MAVERQQQFPGGDAVAVVLDADQPLAAVGEGDVDAAGAGVQGVLDQLLDRRSRALDDLARGDAVGRRGVEQANGPTAGVYLGALGIHAPKFSMGARLGATG